MFALAKLPTAPAMLLRRSVKAASVANLTDARYFAALGVEYLGFALEPGGIPWAEAAAVREWVSGPQIVAECGGMSAAAIVEACEALRPDAVEVGAFAKTVDVAAATALPVLRRLPIGGDVTLDIARSITAGDQVAGTVVDAASFPAGWGGLKGDGEWLAWVGELAGAGSVWLDVPLSGGELGEAMARLPRAGFQVRGGEEEAVGVKSFEELDEWFEVMEVD